MRKHRFFFNQALTLNEQINFDAETSHQISRVLRLQIDDIIYVFNNTNIEFTAKIVAISKKNVSAIITAQTHLQDSIPGFKINLGQVIGKGEKMELVIQKATELGIHSITPLYSERSVVKLNAERSLNKHEHWQKIAIAASCQSWRNDVPLINPPQDLMDWISNNNDPNKIILSPHHGSQRIVDLVIADAATLLIGPEGGFSNTEVECALAKNFQAASLGPRILRTETAAIAAIAIMQAKFGDL